MYSRSRGVVGSSGMEHVFVGEWNDSGILGLHSWIRYAFLEQDYYVNYLGYIRLINLGEVSIHFIICSKPEGMFSEPP